MFSMHMQAKQGDFVKDLGYQNRSLGLVKHVDKRTGMMLVVFPKINKTQWIMWRNYGHYKVV